MTNRPEGEQPEMTPAKLKKAYIPDIKDALQRHHDYYVRRSRVGEELDAADQEQLAEALRRESAGLVKPLADEPETPTVNAPQTDK